MPTTSPTENAAGIGHRNRSLLEQLHRRTAGTFDVGEASTVLGLGREDTSRLLAYLARRGWLFRVRRGLYVTVPLDARRSGEWVEDQWVVAHRVFSPCYIGGWSAGEYWDLTEQVFRTLLVVTARRVRHRDIEIQALPIHATVRNEAMMFGTVGVWRGQTRVDVSDPSRTVIDILDDPSLGGGIRTVADMLYEYFSSDHRDDDLLVRYGDRVGNHAVFKRLGYLLERLPIDSAGLVDACLERRSTGLIALDPSVKAPGPIVRRWRLRANVGLGLPGASS